MHRETLISLLEQVRPALSALELQPVMSHYWFTGKKLMTFNGEISLEVACPTEFKGAVSPLLLQVLKAHKANEVTFEPSDDVLVMRAGKSRIKLPMIGADVFADVFEMPKFKAKEPLDIDASKFLRIMSAVSMSLGTDMSRSDYMGVTFMKNKKGYELFSTDANTLSHAVMKLSGVDWEDRFVVPTNFVRQLGRIGDGALSIKLEITDGYALFSNQGVKLWGRLVEADRPLPWNKIMTDNVPAGLDSSATEVPSKLSMILDRASIMTSGTAAAGARTKINCSDGKIRFDTVSPLGEAHDVISADKGQKDVTLSVDPLRVKDGVGRFSHWAIAERVVVFFAPDDRTSYVVTAVV